MWFKWQAVNFHQPNCFCHLSPGPYRSIPGLKNYRPVSNLPTLSKIIEKLVVAQLQHHMRVNGLDEKMQSAYKSGHSTETALLRLKNDMLMAIDGRKAVILVLLDLSAVFDTVDHEIMCRRLERLLGLRGKPLAWFRSYLTARSQCVSVEEALSEILCLLFGVPQGSVLGPILFTIYTLPLSKIADRHGIQIHMYADDTQLYVSYDVTDMEQRQEVSVRLEKCISDIQSWMVTNKLQLNGSKTPTSASTLGIFIWKLITTWFHLVTLPKISVYSWTNISTWSLMWLVYARPRTSIYGTFRA